MPALLFGANSLVHQAYNTKHPPRPYPPRWPRQSCSNLFNGQSLESFRDEILSCKSTDELGALSVVKLGQDVIAPLLSQLDAAKESGAESIIVMSGQCCKPKGLEHAGHTDTLCSAFGTLASQQRIAVIQIESLAHHNHDDDDCPDVGEGDAGFIRLMQAGKMDVISAFGIPIRQLIVYGATGAYIFCVDKLSVTEDHSVGWLPQGLEVTALSHIGVLGWAKRKRKGAILIGFLLVLLNLLTISGLEDRSRAYNTVNQALEDGTASWKSPSLASSLQSVQLTANDFASANSNVGFAILRQEEANAFVKRFVPERVGVVYRYSSDPVHLNGSELRGLRALLGRRAQKDFAKVYGVVLPLERFKIIVATGSGLKTALEYRINLSWVTADSSFVHFFDGVDRGDFPLVIVIGASTIASPATLGFVAHDAGPEGVVLYSDWSDVEPDVLSAAPLAAALLADLSTVEHVSPPDVDSVLDDITAALAPIGNIGTRHQRDFRQTGSRLSKRCYVVWSCYYSRSASNWTGRKQTFENIAHRWDFEVLRKNVGSVRLTPEEKALFDAQDEASSQISPLSIEREEELEQRYADLGPLFAAPHVRHGKEGVGLESFSMAHYASTAERKALDFEMAMWSGEDGDYSEDEGAEDEEDEVERNVRKRRRSASTSGEGGAAEESGSPLPEARQLRRSRTPNTPTSRLAASLPPSSSPSAPSSSPSLNSTPPSLQAVPPSFGPTPLSSSTLTHTHSQPHSNRAPPTAIPNHEHSLGTSPEFVATPCPSAATPPRPGKRGRDESSLVAPPAATPRPRTRLLTGGVAREGAALLRKTFEPKELEDELEERGLRMGREGVSIPVLRGVAKKLRTPGDEREDVPAMPKVGGAQGIEARDRIEGMLWDLVCKRLRARFDEEVVQRILGASYEKPKWTPPTQALPHQPSTEHSLSPPPFLCLYFLPLSARLLGAACLTPLPCPSPSWD